MSAFTRPAAAPPPREAHLTASPGLKDKWKLEKLTDRLGKTTTFGYVPVTVPGATVETTVTDATPRATKYLTDSFGRPGQTTNAKNEVTKLSWDGTSTNRSPGPTDQSGAPGRRSTRSGAPQ